MESFRVTWRSSGLPAGEWRVSSICRPTKSKACRDMYLASRYKEMFKKERLTGKLL